MLYFRLDLTGCSLPLSILSSVDPKYNQPFNLHPEIIPGWHPEKNPCFQGGHLFFSSDLWYKPAFFHSGDPPKNMGLQILKLSSIWNWHWFLMIWEIRVQIIRPNIWYFSDCWDFAHKSFLNSSYKTEYWNLLQNLRHFIYKMFWMNLKSKMERFLFQWKNNFFF